MKPGSRLIKILIALVSIVFSSCDTFGKKEIVGTYQIDKTNVNERVIPSDDRIARFGISTIALDDNSFIFTYRDAIKKGTWSLGTRDGENQFLNFKLQTQIQSANEWFNLIFRRAERVVRRCFRDGFIR